MNLAKRDFLPEKNTFLAEKVKRVLEVK